MINLKEIFKLSKFELKTLLVSFLFLCVCFAPLFCNFIWGNHDWVPIKSDTTLNYGLIEGRFSQYLFQQVFFGGKVLPIFNMIIGFFAYILGIILLVKRFFNFKVSSLCDIIVLCGIISQPFIIEILYFSFVSIGLLSWIFVLSLSLICFEMKGAFYKIIANLLLFLALGGYPASINFVVVALVCKAWQNYNQDNYTIKQLIKKNAFYLINICALFVILKYIYLYLQQNNLMVEMYNTSNNSLWQIISGLPNVILQSIISFIEPQPYISLMLLGIICGIFILFCINLYLQSKSFKQIIINTLLLVALLISLKFSQSLININNDNILTNWDPPFKMMRISFYAMSGLLAFILFYLKEKNVLYKNTIYIVCAVLMLINLFNNLYFSKVQVLGFKAEDKLLSRVISRIYNHPNFSKHYYQIQQAGDIGLRIKYYDIKSFEQYGYYSLHTAFTRYWQAPDYYNFYEPEIFIKSTKAIDFDNMTIKMQDYFVDKIKIWPHKNSLYLEDNKIIIILNTQIKDMMQEQFNSLRIQRK